MHRTCTARVLSPSRPSHCVLRLLRATGLAESDAAVVTSHMAAALEHLHSLGVAHRDVKPANILQDGTEGKPIWRLCDFGFSVQAGPEGKQRLKSKLGTLAYCAPEILFQNTAGGAGSAGGTSGKPPSGYLGPPVDMWALGCTVYEMRIGR